MTSNDDPVNSTSDSVSLHSLMSQKARLESCIAQLHASLESLNSDAHAPLIDTEGFPRSDLDIAAIKTLRAQLSICFNDHKTLMQQVAQFLEHHFQEKSETPAAIPMPQPVAMEPIALVKSILPDSAADAAGLRPNDAILQFGPLNDTTLVSFIADFRQILQQRENETIAVVVLRGTANSPLLERETRHLSLRLPSKGQSLG